MISGVSQVVVPVDDQDVAKEFWTTVMGFSLVTDQTYGDERWIEVAPPDRRVRLVLGPRQPGEPRREAPDQLPHSDVFFTCADIESTYAELTQRGVKFPSSPVRMHFGWWSMFEDADGTRYALGQE